MTAPWQENQQKVVVEFLKGNQGARRIIHLKHSAAAVPPQLAGRINPGVWQAFMTDVEQAAQQHPYVLPPSAGRMGSWVGAALLGAVLGVCCISPDGGDYGVWLQQVQSIIARHQASFAAAGANLSLQRAQHSYWLQIDVAPGPVVGHPVFPPPGDAGAHKPGFQKY
eukprot:GHRQ01012444.1.p1 GENE.GHRQ01012444.1~~GHRQ01012444.1.p1  ORF type:complete len:167 (+),score=36.57 GHRQ01012444.1:727-1227(+)